MIRTPKSVGLKFETMSIPSLDGTKLCAWMINCPQSKKLAIVAHPHGASKGG